jgi:hypothetical protein
LLRRAAGTPVVSVTALAVKVAQKLAAAAEETENTEAQEWLESLGSTQARARGTKGTRSAPRFILDK